MIRPSVIVALTWMVFSCGVAHAIPYIFQNVIDTNTGLVSFGEPSLNDAGVVAFGGSVSGFDAGVFISDGTTVTPIALGSGFGTTALVNSAGFVAFAQSGTPTSIFLGDGSTTETIADNQTVFSGVGGITDWISASFAFRDSDLIVNSRFNASPLVVASS